MSPLLLTTIVSPMIITILSPTTHRALFISDGVVLNPQSYMRGLWAACQAEAERGGSEVALDRDRRVSGIARDLPEFDRVVVAAGAASADIGDTCCGM